MEKMIGFLLAACIFCIVEWVRELHSFRITHYHIDSPKLKKLKNERKVILLSDLHNHCYGKENEKLLSAIRNERPDVILIAGDMPVGRAGDSVEAAEKFVSKLPGIAPTYYGMGNHEQRMKNEPEKYGNVYEAYHKNLAACGVQFLENQKAELEWDGIPVHIHGLEIPANCYTRLRQVSFGQKNIETLLGKAEPSGYQILIAHNPAFSPVYLEWGADLSVSGHLHGGIVRIPFLGGIITPQMKLFPKYSGELTMEGNSAVVVSKGLGTHTINVRFLNPAEIVVLHMNGEV